MNRKVKELIPLFAIGIMVIGAVMLLVAMNSTEDGTKKLDEKQEVKNEGKIKIDNEVSEPVAVIKEDETKDEKNDDVKVDNGVSFDILNGTTTTTSTPTTPVTTSTETTTVNTETTATDSASGMKSYIESMVNGFLPATTTSTTTNTPINTATLADSASHFITSAPTTTTSTVTSKATGKTSTVTTYNNISKSVNIGNYVVSTTSNNKIILANSSNKNLAISTLDCGTVTILTTNNSYIYAFEQGGGLKKYSIVGGKLLLSAKGYLAFEANELYFSNDYIYMTSTQGALYAYVEREATFVQAGFTREIDSITGITSASGSKVSVRCGNTNYTYTFDGLNFTR